MIADHSQTEEIVWSLATPTRPCPVCGSAQGPCRSNEPLTFAACAHTPSEWLLSTGAWLHAIGEAFDLGTKHAK